MTATGDENQRVGTVERQAAIDALNQHWQAGRLDPAEHERRTTAAYAAVTRGDLDALFTDLPSNVTPPGGQTPAAAPAPAPAPYASQAPQPAAPPPSGGSGLFPAGSWVARNRHVIMGLTPFVALALFFITKWWPFFLLIPALGVVLYAGDDDSRRADRRNY